MYAETEGQVLVLATKVYNLQYTYLLFYIRHIIVIAKNDVIFTVLGIFFRIIHNRINIFFKNRLGDR